MKRPRKRDPEFNPPRTYGPGETGYDPFFGPHGYRDERGLGSHGENPYGYYGQHRYADERAGTKAARSLNLQRGVAEVGVTEVTVPEVDRHEIDLRSGRGTPAARHSTRRGPKNGRRSDARIHDVICERLLESDFIDARAVAVEVHDGNVKLTGTVPKRAMKQAIENVAADCAGVTTVSNAIRIGH